MRKDIKLGLAIAGGLLIVLVIVWSLMPGGDSNNNTNIATDETPETTPDTPDTSSETPTTAETPATTETPAQDTPVTPTETASTSTPAGETGDAFSGGASSGSQEGMGIEYWTQVLNEGSQVRAEGGTDTASGNSTTTSSGTSVERPRTSEPTNTGNNGAETAGFRSTTSVFQSGNTGNTGSAPSTGTPAGTGTSVTPPAATSSGRTHKVQEGDTFSSIAASVYGNAKYYTLIQKANPNVSPESMKIGTVLNLPPKPQDNTPTSTGVAAGTQDINPATQYRVGENDSLYTISMKLYGDAKRVDELYQLNKAAIGDDMNSLKVGTVLKLPEAPTNRVGR